MQKLNKRERILGIQCESFVGPGWYNETITIFIGNVDDRTYRWECLQPESFSEGLRCLFDPAEAIQAALEAEVGKLDAS